MSKAIMNGLTNPANLSTKQLLQKSESLNKQACKLELQAFEINVLVNQRISKQLAQARA